VLVGNRMTRHPVTIGPAELLSAAKTKMETGHFRRLPVVSEGAVVGVITDRDLREHAGHLNQVKVNGAMTATPPGGLAGRFA